MTHPMTNLTDDELGLRLAALTQPVGAPTRLWNRAIPATPAQGISSALNQNVPGSTLGIAAAALLLFALAVVMFPSLGEVRSVSSATPAPSTALDERSLAEVSPSAREAGFSADREGKGRVIDQDTREAYARNESRGASSLSAPADLLRQVIRKATIELTTPDVRAAMLKASMILNLATGEFIEQSSLTGDGPTAQATLTLRVAADRLSEVLNSLRPLGKVTSEQLTGDDVTDQAVDLDARLRNEQRIESELLTLLDTRKDAPLDDILAVRSQLANIRDSIERLTAQRDRLSHLVSLATVLVIIRADTAPPPSTPVAGIWDYFKSSMASSWRAGLSILADTVALLLRIAVGGLIWWIIILSLAATALHYHRRARAAAAREPVPTE